jgi:hypothetical protein
MLKKINGLKRWNMIEYFTESRGQMVNTPASFREVPGSDLGPKTDYRD